MTAVSNADQVKIWEGGLFTTYFMVPSWNFPGEAGGKTTKNFSQHSW
jgi:hypothetical protein